MNRRELIKATALISGYVVSSSIAGGFLQSCQPAGEPDWVPNFFTPEQAAIISEVTETILPHTEDAPGAKDVYLAEFMDSLVGDCFREEAKKDFVDGLTKLEEDCKAKTGSSLLKLSNEDRLAYLREVDKASKAEAKAMQKNPPKRPTDPKAYFDPTPFFLKIKSMTIAGYFTSQEVAENVLVYDPIPGEQIGCIPLEETGGRQYYTR